MKTFVESEYEIHLDDSSSDFLHFVIKGPRANFNISMKYWPQLRKLSSKYSSKGVLIHDMISHVEELTVSDYYSLASYVADAFKGIKQVYYREELPRLIKFAETVGLNKGLGSGGVFYTLDRAKAFLSAK